MGERDSISCKETGGRWDDMVALVGALFLLQACTYTLNGRGHLSRPKGNWAWLACRVPGNVDIVLLTWFSGSGGDGSRWSWRCKAESRASPQSRCFCTAHPGWAGSTVHTHRPRDWAGARAGGRRADSLLTNQRRAFDGLHRLAAFGRRARLRGSSKLPGHHASQDSLEVFSSAAFHIVHSARGSLSYLGAHVQLHPSIAFALPPTAPSPPDLSTWACSLTSSLPLAPSQHENNR
jgi:hypothetical protein